ncbi:MAG: hypothetical protein AAF541_17095 [Pseudomonadota bacterium]
MNISPNPAKADQQITIAWDARHVDECYASGSAWSGPKEATGRENLGPFNSDQRFLISCSQGSMGTNQKQYLVVKQTGEVEVNIHVKRKLLLRGKQTTLSWQAKNADRCVADGAWDGEQAIKGKYNTLPIHEPMTFRLMCSNDDQSSMAMTSIEPVDHWLAWDPPATYTDGTPMSVSAYIIYWGTEPQKQTHKSQLPGTATAWSQDLDIGTYYVKMTAVDAAGFESEPSPEVVVEVN